MAINQNCGSAGPMFIAGPDNGMTFRRYKLRLQTDPVELVHQPVCTLDQLFLVLVISRDAWKPQERIILLEIIVAHGEKLIGFCRLPTLSDEVGCGPDKKPTPTRELLPQLASPRVSNYQSHCRSMPIDQGSRRWRRSRARARFSSQEN